MGDGMSPLDPIFWLHHCMVDRVWAQWENDGNTTPPLSRNYAGQFVGGDGRPVSASSAGALNFVALGFTYDVLLQGPHAALLSTPIQGARTLQVLAASSSRIQVRPKIESRATVSVSGMSKEMAKFRTFWSLEPSPNREVAQEPSRILAHFVDVMVPERPVPLIVNVFVNCPYLSAATASTDLHFAGSFSFFGMHGESHRHSDYFVDITGPLRALRRNGQLRSDDIQIQFMAIPVDPRRDYDVTLSIGRVEVISS